MAGRIQIEVGGQDFIVSTETLQNGVTSRLTKMCLSEGNMSRSSYRTVDRPSEMFAAILALYQTGELHIPMTSCPGAFLKELDFWEISPEMISDCCHNRVQSFLTEQATLKEFKRNLQRDMVAEKYKLSSCNCLGEFRSKLWSVIGYAQPSIVGRVYFVISLFMVLLSIFTLAYSTDPSFQRAMTNCERLEYMASSGMEGYELVKNSLEQYCHEEALPEHHSLSPTILSSVAQQEDFDNEYEYLFTQIFVPYDDYNDTYNNYDIEAFSDDENDYIGQHPAGNLANASPEFSAPQSQSKEVNLKKNSKLKRVKLPNMKVKIYTLVVLEVITMVYFTLDFVLRIFSCPSIGLYFLSIINTSDALALIGSYLHMLIVHIYEHERYKRGWTDVLEFSQMLRSFRLFRIVANVKAGKVLAFTVKSNLKDLSVLILFLVAGMCTFASCFYISEDRKNVPSIPAGWYWAIVTMTTVGYGDIYPKTSFGRCVGCLCAITGVMLFALTVPIFANNFLALYQLADSEQAKQLKERSSKQTVVNESSTTSMSPDNDKTGHLHEKKSEDTV